MFELRFIIVVVYLEARYRQALFLQILWPLQVTHSEKEVPIMMLSANMSKISAMKCHAVQLHADGFAVLANARQVIDGGFHGARSWVLSSKCWGVTNPL